MFEASVKGWKETGFWSRCGRLHRNQTAFAVDAVLVILSVVWFLEFFFLFNLSSLQSPKLKARFSEVVQK